MSAAAPHAPDRARVFIALGLVYAIWSSTYFAIRVQVESLPPFLSGGARYVVAGAILLAFQRMRGKPLPTRSQWLRAIPIGALLFGIGNGLVASAERSIGSGVAAVVCGTTPLWAAVIGPLFGERATLREWMGMGLGFAGVCVLGLGGDLRADPIATTLLLLAPVGWAIGSLLARKLDSAPGASGAASQLVVGGAIMMLVGPVIGERWPTGEIPIAPLVALAYLTIFGSLVAFSAYHYVLTNARPAIAMSYAYVNPVLALALGASLGAEEVGPPVFVATAMIAGAVLLIIRGKEKVAKVVVESAPITRESRPPA
jgi:drug/metabolite transporter (DMT)-like permease